MVTGSRIRCGTLSIIYAAGDCTTQFAEAYYNTLMNRDYIACV